MNKALRSLMTHSRDMMCYFTEKNSAYIIPMMFSTEKDFGRSIELQINKYEPGQLFVLERLEYKTVIRPVHSKETSVDVLQ
jgi:hypothetical protein